MAAATHDITVERGVDLKINLTVQQAGVAADLTGATLCSQIRRTKESPDLAVAFSVTYPNRSAGQARLSLTAAQTASTLQKLFRSSIRLHPRSTCFASPAQAAASRRRSLAFCL